MSGTGKPPTAKTFTWAGEHWELQAVVQLGSVWKGRAEKVEKPLVQKPVYGYLGETFCQVEEISRDRLLLSGVGRPPLGLFEWQGREFYLPAVICEREAWEGTAWHTRS